MTISGVRQLDDRLWETSLAPRDVRTLGSCTSSVGSISVLLLRGASVDEQDGALRFPLDAATVLNIGSDHRTIIIATAPTDTAPEKDTVPKKQPISPDHAPMPAAAARTIGLSGGDSEFVEALKSNSLPEDLREAGEAILKRVREHFPGSLKAVGARRFQETPDNFWFVTIQPRDQSLSVTVRGLPDRFNVTSLRVVMDRPPYSRFKVRGMSDVAEAVRVILNAVRKGG
jgi:hypothetical protein